VESFELTTIRVSMNVSSGQANSQQTTPEKAIAQ
jgi:hypothetical protein